MAKKCNFCGKDASFVAGGGKLYGKNLCFDCYNKAADVKSEEELKAMGFDGATDINNSSYDGQGFITALRVLAGVNLFISIVLAFNIWSSGADFLVGISSILTGAVIFTVLYVFSYIAENVIAIRLHLESKDKKE